MAGRSDQFIEGTSADEPIRPRCFVIQPFDNDGKYDRRFVDTFAPAIEAAGLSPYRVDQDPSTRVVIDDIEDAIRESAIVFAEVTEDRPNIWYEVGYARACAKEVCLVCETGRKLPFDIRHLAIELYDSRSKDDFTDIETRVTKRLKGLLSRANAARTVSSLSPALVTEGLSLPEIGALTIIARGEELEAGIELQEYHRLMSVAGYNRVGANVASKNLERRGLIEKCVISHTDETYGDWEAQGYRPGLAGVDWLLANSGQLNLQDQTDDVVPF